MRQVVVIGGGITGLSAAVKLRERHPDWSITILESSPRAGGQIGTSHRDGFTVERGPNGLFDAKPAGVQLARDMGLADRLIAGSEASRKNRFLFTRDRLHRLPSGPFGILTNPVLSLRGRLTLMAEPFRRKSRGTADESIAAFARRRFGREAADTLIDAVVTGIYAGDPETLSVKSCFPRLVAAEEKRGSVLRGILAMRKEKAQEARARGEAPPGPQRLWSFPTGLHELTDALADRLGPRLITGVTVSSVRRTAESWRVMANGDEWPADVVITCCPAAEQARILHDLDPVLAEEFAAISSNKIAVVALGYRQADVAGPQDGFGYLSPQRERRDVLGVQWCSSVFPGRAPAGCVLWRALCGGVTRTDVAEWPDDRLLKAVHDEMKHVMGVRGEPVFSEIVRWPRAIPQYTLGHAERVERIRTLAKPHPGLILAGNALTGVSLADRAEDAARIVESVGACFPSET